ncbi:hypothetical protein ABT404_01305 [Streptomyces hyaluromycini]|uniref:Transposase n=1 Tax=Streptomyces hyaluromycini TaxID=1377993 RepID=A0ABV1WMY1_9ACTN
MPLTRVVLASGRSIGLTHLRLSSTYGGLLEGYPHRALNDRRVRGLLSVWFQATPQPPSGHDADRGLREVAWEELAQDYEL